MREYRAEQIVTAMLRRIHRHGMKFRNIRIDRRRFKKWLAECFVKYGKDDEE